MIPAIDRPSVDLRTLPMHSKCTVLGCRKKELTAAMICRCQATICSLHKGEHGCTFDYRADRKEEAGASRFVVEHFHSRFQDEV